MAICDKTGKRKYRTSVDAQLIMARIGVINKRKRKQRFSEEPIRAYRCEFCGQYHLTHQAKGEGRGNE